MSDEANSITFTPEPRVNQNERYLKSPWGLLVHSNHDRWYDRKGHAFTVVFNVPNDQVGYDGSITVTRL